MSERDLIERARNAADNIGRELSTGSMLPPVLSGGTDMTAEFAAETLRALASAHEATIARLSEALAEAEKKGAEVRPLDWEHHPQAAGQVRAPSPFGTYRIVFFGDYALWGIPSSERSLRNRVDSIEAAKVAAQADFAERVQTCLAPPRDLSQGGQHG